MRTVTVRQIQELDRMVIENIGIPSLVLMENAGKAVAEEVKKNLTRRKNLCVCVVCGRGNNAGDGFVTARYLLNAGIKTKIFLIGEEKDLKEDAAVHYQILKKTGYSVVSVIQSDGVLLQNLSQANVVVDAIFGVGLNRLIEEPFKSIIQAMNRGAKYIIAVDIPSGLDGTTGKIYGICVKANRTVTLSFIKKGFLIREGPQYVGRVVVADIGIPKKLLNKI